MKLENHDIKRLAIYAFYDQWGVVDDYVLYLLRNLIENLSELLVVCNGNLTPAGRKKLEDLTPNVFVRENQGFDVWAYKEGMEYYGWDKLKGLDELVLLNSTIMGPIYPFRSMFTEMNARDVDFWGITTHPKLKYDPFGKCKYGYLPLHLQSYFISIRKHMLQSIDYKRYWDELPTISTYAEAVCWHEAIFTKEFEDKGFTWQAFVDTSDLEKYVTNPLMMNPLELIQNRRCPIFKRKSFYNNYEQFIYFGDVNASMDVFEFIKKQTTYDVNMVWDNLLRTENLADIKNCLQLNYIIPSNVMENKEENHREIALVMHLYFVDLIGYCFNFAKSMPTHCDVFITTDTEEKKAEILKIFQELSCRKLNVSVIENRGRTESALLVAARRFIMNYDYVCFAHDKKVGQLDWGIKGASFSYQCFENLLKNSIFVENVINVFEKNPRLGLLTPPPPGFGDYYFTFGFGWSQNYQVTKKLADELNLTVPICEDKDPIAPLGTMFWFRPQAIKILFDKDWDYSDFPKEPNAEDGTLLHAIERVYPFVAQQAGYYSAWVLADSFAKIEVTNLNFMLSELNKKLFRIYGFNTHQGLINTMNSSIIDGSPGAKVDNALRILIIQKIKGILPKGIWGFLRRIYYFFQRR